MVRLCKNISATAAAVKRKRLSTTEAAKDTGATEDLKKVGRTRSNLHTLTCDEISRGRNASKTIRVTGKPIIQDDVYRHTFLSNTGVHPSLPYLYGVNHGFASVTGRQPIHS